MRLIIAGGRDFNDYRLLVDTADWFLSAYRYAEEPIEIVSGGARGADLLGEMYAKDKDYPIMNFYANWDEFGKGAGYIRNTAMAKYGTALIAFWDGTSRGTEHMIKEGVKMQIPVLIISYLSRS